MKKITINIDGKELQAQIEESELAKLEEKGVRPPRAEDGGQYFYLNNSNTPLATIEAGSSFDDHRYYSRNYFLTEEEVRKRQEYNEAIARINKYVIENRMWFEPDWGDANQIKIYLYYDFENKKWDNETAMQINRFSPLPWFATLAHAEKVIEDCADDLEIIKNYHLK